MSQLPQIVFVLGGPGSGKSTQCSNIVERYNFKHISAGQLLRDEMARDQSKFKSLIETYLREGVIVPVEITCSLIKQAIDKMVAEEGEQSQKPVRILIDGFPRNQDNLDGWNRQLADQVELLFVLFLDCSLQVCKDRCLARGVAGSGRNDDNLDSLQKRFNTYLNHSIPIIDYFKKTNRLKHIDASRSLEQVFDEIRAIFESI